MGAVVREFLAEVLVVLVLLGKNFIKFTKHLMTGPEGNSSFCFPRISMFEIRGNSRGISH